MFISPHITFMTLNNPEFDPNQINFQHLSNQSKDIQIKWNTRRSIKFLLNNEQMTKLVCSVWFVARTLSVTVSRCQCSNYSHALFLLNLRIGPVACGVRRLSRMINQYNNIPSRRLARTFVSSDDISIDIDPTISVHTIFNDPPLWFTSFKFIFGALVALAVSLHSQMWA